MSAPFLQSVITSATSSEPQVFTLIEPPFRIVHVNAAWCLLCGYAANEALGKSLKLLQGAATDRQVLNAMHAALAQRRGARVRLINYKKDQSAFENDLTVTPLTDEMGAVSHFLGVLRDAGIQGRSDALIARNPAIADIPVAAPDSSMQRGAGSCGWPPGPLCGASSAVVQGSCSTAQGLISQGLLLSREQFPLYTLHNHPIAPVLLRMLQLGGNAGGADRLWGVREDTSGGVGDNGGGGGGSGGGSGSTSNDDFIAAVVAQGVVTCARSSAQCDGSGIAPGLCSTGQEPSRKRGCDLQYHNQEGDGGQPKQAPPRSSSPAASSSGSQRRIMPRSSSVQSLTNDNYLIGANDVLDMLDSFWSEEPAGSERGATPRLDT